MSLPEDDYLLLSGIQHFAFCRRQWALIHIEQQWFDNERTIDGELMHANAHNPDFKEERKDIIIRRSLPVKSERLQISGVCDVVEFIPDETGIFLYGKKGKYRVLPVEYKRGKPKDNAADILQVVAQSICLEEMLSCKINTSCIYYGETRHRMKVENTPEYRESVEEMVYEMRQYYERRYTPDVRHSKSCLACSMRDLCIPLFKKKQSVEEYIDDAIKEG